MSLFNRLSAALNAMPLHPLDDESALGPHDEDHVPAAVLIPITDRPQPGVVLTQRPQWLRAHGGQVAFPGGKVDPGDSDATATALREAEEELGLSSRDVRIVGQTAPFLSGSGFRITPVIAVIPPDLRFDPNPEEVEDWFEVPAATLFDADAYSRQQAFWRGADRHFYELYWQERRIWGVTAGIIINLTRRLRLAELVA